MLQNSYFIIQNCCFHLYVSLNICSINPSVKVYSSAYSGQSCDSVRSLGKFGIGIEVGSIPQGILNAEFFQITEVLVHAILDYLEQYNQGEILAFKNTLVFYRYMGTTDYPRNEHGEIKPMIHPQLQSKDYEALNPGDPVFLTFDGQTIYYEANSTAYPVFINEAAYYEKGIAMCLTQKHQITI